MTTGLIWAGALLIAMGWFAIGWVARGQENRKYAESRLRYLAGQAVAERVPAGPVYQPVPMWGGYPVAPSVHAYHLAPPAPPVVVDGQVVREIPAGWS